MAHIQVVTAVDFGQCRRDCRICQLSRCDRQRSYIAGELNGCELGIGLQRIELIGYVDAVVAHAQGHDVVMPGFKYFCAGCTHCRQVESRVYLEQVQSTGSRCELRLADSQWRGVGLFNFRYLHTHVLQLAQPQRKLCARVFDLDRSHMAIGQYLGGLGSSHTADLQVISTHHFVEKSLLTEPLATGDGHGDTCVALLDAADFFAHGIQSIQLTCNVAACIADAHRHHLAVGCTRSRVGNGHVGQRQTVGAHHFGKYCRARQVTARGCSCKLRIGQRYRGGVAHLCDGIYF